MKQARIANAKPGYIGQRGSIGGLDFEVILVLEVKAK